MNVLHRIRHQLNESNEMRSIDWRHRAFVYHPPKILVHPPITSVSNLLLVAP